MKKILVTLIIISCIFITNVNGQTKEATPSQGLISPTSTNEQKEIDTLKEKIATKVAELREKNNRAVSGNIQSISNNFIKIISDNGKDYNVKIDETLTKYFQIIGSQKKEARLTDLKKGSFIIVTGVINDREVTANFVYTDELFLVRSGKISEVNKENYYIKVVTSEKDDITLDIETNTKMTMLNIKTMEMDKIGFSKFKEGDTIHFVVKKTGEEKETNRYSPLKILVIPQEYFMK